MKTRNRDALSMFAALFAALCVVAGGAYSQTPGGGDAGSTGTQRATPAQTDSPAGAQTPSPPGAQPSSPAGTQPDSPPSARSNDPRSSDPRPTAPRGLTPRQRQQQQQQGAQGASETAVTCTQENELARSECLRRDATDDDDRPAGVTRSMQQRRQQAQIDAANATSADPRSDETGARSRTRTAASGMPTGEQDEATTDTAADDAEQASDANTESDTLGSER